MSESPTIITLTLPSSDRLDAEGTLLIQRGTLAHLTQFTYIDMQDVMAAIQAAYIALAAVEIDPPVVPEAPPVVIPPRPSKSIEPMLSIPVGKKMLDIPAHNLQMVQPDQQALALQIAGKLISGKLWDGQTPIIITDAAHAWHRMKHLSDKELALFKLEDFAQNHLDEAPVSSPITEASEREDVLLSVGQRVHLVAGAVDRDGDHVPFHVGRIVEIDPSDEPPYAWVESSEGDHDIWISLDQLQPLTTSL